MRIVKKALLVLAILAAVLAGVGLVLPRQVHVERSAVIDAPAPAVFVLVNGFRNFNRWSPWHEMDPAAKYTYEGPEFGAGAKMTWSGDPKTVGSGSEEILESRPYEAIRVSLDFGPEGKAGALFTFAREGGATRVTWGFDTDLGMNPVTRYLGLMSDGMIGKDFEKGLAGLKALAETLPKADFSDLAIEAVDVAPVTVAYIATTSPKDDKAIANAIGTAYGQVGRFLAAQRLKQAGAPLTINTKWDDTGYAFDAAIPVDRAPDRPTPTASPVKVKQTYGGRALKAVHKGSYQGMPATYDKLLAYAAAYGYEHAGPPWDEYVSDPGSTPEPDLITHIYLPIR